ncbi:MAG: recombinase A [Myxococcota bacterium]
MTVGVGLVLSAQSDGEPVAWIASPQRLFFPPDLAASGVDLEALAVVRVDGANAMARAADKLLRSGAFGLVVLDLGRENTIPQALQSRLVGLTQKHESAVVMLTEKSSQHESVGSLISLRAQAKRVRLSVGRFACELDIIKDKRRGPGWTHRELHRGPMGLR